MIPASQILYEDNHIIICNKPSGVLVHGDETGDKALLDYLKSYVKKKYNKPGNVFLGAVHRLDRPTSGCIIYARTSKALTRMTKMFAAREVRKEYWALVQKGDISALGTLVDFLKKMDKKNIVRCYDKAISGAKRSELEYEVIRYYKSTQLLKVLLKTGRKHQIRIQLSNIGAPIVGDLKYGFPLPNKDKSICLHCRSLSFIHPVSKIDISVTAPLPEVKEWKEVNKSFN